MVAELKSVAGQPRLPLLLEPDRPKSIDHRTVGWRRVKGEIVRHHAHDVFGALVQHVIVRYLVHGVPRQQIASEVNYSERQVQAWISGRAHTAYAAPVRRALESLGIGMGKGGLHPASGRGRPYRRIAAACLDLLADVPWLLATDTRPQAVRVRTLARLLSAGREALG